MKGRRKRLPATADLCAPHLGGDQRGCWRGKVSACPAGNVRSYLRDTECDCDRQNEGPQYHFPQSDRYRTQGSNGYFRGARRSGWFAGLPFYFPHRPNDCSICEICYRLYRNGLIVPGDLPNQKGLG
jgi:hypothetical protein